MEKNAPGTFCWNELATSDLAAGKSFYMQLFNWSAVDTPVGPDQYYTTFNIAGDNVGAAYQQGPQEAGIPPHWNLYIAVADADASARKATELGAKILAGPFNVMEHGRMAVVRDPQGAVFCLWEARQHKGLGIKGENNSFCWADLNTPDQGAGSRFYSQLFGWELEPGDGGYLHIKSGDEFIGGIPGPQQLPPDIPPHWMIYVQVENCDASTERARALGANIHFGPITLENTGRFTVLADPQNAAFALFQPLPREK